MPVNNPEGPRPHPVARLATTTLAALALWAVVASSTFAAAPETGPSGNFPYDFGAGEVCRDPLRFANSTQRARDSAFDVAPDGSQRLLTRGMAVSSVTDLATGAVYPMQGGYIVAVKVAADGSIRVDARGTDVIAWYFPGDASDLGPGLFDVNGHVTEWYAPDGSFIRATFSGSATDICAALGA